MAEPVVSIVIPAYNAEKFLAETIRSVQSQTFREWELFIIDDGSKDDTKKIAESFLSDVRIQYIFQQNAGVSAARNHGLRLSKGEFIAFLDADDVWLPENLEKKVRFFNTAKECVLVHASVENIDENSKRTGVVNAGKQGLVLEDLLSWNGTVVPGPSSMLARRNDVERIGGFDPEFSTAADQDFFFRLAATGKNFGMIPGVLSLYRVHGSNMHQNIALMEKDHVGVYKKAYRNGLFSSKRFAKKCFANLYLILAGSWWKNGKNKMRAMKFMLHAVFIYPPSISKLIRKLR